MKIKAPSLEEVLKKARLSSDDVVMVQGNRQLPCGVDAANEILKVLLK